MDNTYGGFKGMDIIILTDHIINLKKRLEDCQNLQSIENAIDWRRIPDLEEQIENLTNQFNGFSIGINNPKKNSNLSINSFVKGV